MRQNNIFGGVSGVFWSLTFLLIGCSIFVASVGDPDLTRVFLMVMAAYTVLGIAYGIWAARDAVMRSKIG